MLIYYIISCIFTIISLNLSFSEKNKTLPLFKLKRKPWIFVSKEKALFMFEGGGRIQQKQFLYPLRRFKRSAVGPSHELGKNERYTKPWNWFSPHNHFFDFYIKELREIHRYPGSWFGVPKGIDFSYLPDKNEYQRLMLDQRSNAYSLINIIQYEKAHNRFPAKHFNAEYISIYYRYAKCLLNDNPYRNCPDPCNDPNACKRIAHSNNHCKSFTDPLKRPKISRKHYSLFSRIFKKSFDCGCKRGYDWKRRLRKCVDGVRDCEVGGDGTALTRMPGEGKAGSGPCMNGGTCTELSDARVGYRCDCMPAYRGHSCQLPRDPCRGNVTCQPRHPCRRDPANWLLGYRCDCRIGWEPQSRQDPRCVDINECKLKSPCRNGATCINNDGSFVCRCRKGFQGKLCGQRVIVRAEWTEWGPYSRCSVTCGDGGNQKSYRKCSVSAKCVGTNMRTRRCRDVPTHCELDTVFDDSIGLEKSAKEAGPDGVYRGSKNPPPIGDDRAEYDEGEEQYYASEEEVSRKYEEEDTLDVGEVGESVGEKEDEIEAKKQTNQKQGKTSKRLSSGQVPVRFNLRVILHACLVALFLNVNLL